MQAVPLECNLHYLSFVGLIASWKQECVSAMQRIKWTMRRPPLRGNSWLPGRLRPLPRGLCEGDRATSDEAQLLALDNKLLIYKSCSEPVWTYCMQLWGTSSKSNIQIIQRHQPKVLRNIANAS
ncbi:hypothetical protein R5R35_006639 [Gryllus longicercus]|uniref:Uncharacterized protein n=1 Tax=Gryllus longicercus TaxID=2509291 RepID=A0AAN9V421_9ORTH